ncbi:Kelch repeat-containing protein [Mangrovimonas futianensis]|uniref:Kelch repeat-containing protein n=1 Tax=Mangrovimonas futianensis TaxID=2895523 RepID=UPI001E658038|nr:kelch repeat-containing protein [Mangrovimonas futianensis]MCF1423161.1 hypothetical protein [Mangrovimonas futianensis]
MKNNRISTYLLILFLIISCGKDDDSSSNLPPNDFQLLQVENNAINVSLNPQLVWENALDPDGDTVTYTLLLDLGIENPVTTISSNITSTSFNIVTELERNSNYFWRIIATDNNGNTTESEVFTFTTIEITQTLVTSNADFSTRTEHSLIEFNGKLWVIGGYHASNGGINGGLLNDVWSSSDGINWTEEVPNNSPKSFTPRTDHTTLVFQNKIWVISGGGTASLLNDVWSSPDGITWTQETASANFPARYAHTSVVFDNRIWIIGGRSQSSSYLNDVWSSTDGVTWTQETNNAAFMPRGFHSCGVFQEKIWVIGGYVSGNMNDIWSSSDGINWIEETSNSGFSERRGQSTVIYKNRIWVIAGDLNNDVWSSADGINWKVEISNANFAGRGDQANVVFDDKLWIVGGWMGSLLNDIWYLD